MRGEITSDLTFVLIVGLIGDLGGTLVVLVIVERRGVVMVRSFYDLKE